MREKLSPSLFSGLSVRLQGPHMFSTRSPLWSLYITFLVNILSSHKPLGRRHHASCLEAGVHTAPFFHLRGLAIRCPKAAGPQTSTPSTLHHKHSVPSRRRRADPHPNSVLKLGPEVPTQHCWGSECNIPSASRKAQTWPRAQAGKLTSLFLLGVLCCIINYTKLRDLEK